MTFSDPTGRPTSRTLTIPEAAEALGVSSWAAYESVKRGDFPVPVIRVGRRVVVPRAALEALLGAQSVDVA